MSNRDVQPAKPDDLTPVQWKRWYLLVIVLHVIVIMLMYLFTITYHP